MATAPKAAPKIVSIDEGSATSAQKPLRKKLLFVGLIILALCTGAAGAWYYLGKRPPSIPVPDPVYMPLEQFVVNLQADFGEQYLQTAITLQVSDKETLERLKIYMPLVRSRLLLILSSKKAADINSPAGKEQLREELLASLREPLAPNLPPTSIHDAFFTAFVIQ